MSYKAQYRIGTEEHTEVIEANKDSMARKLAIEKIDELRESPLYRDSKRIYFERLIMSYEAVYRINKREEYSEKFEARKDSEAYNLAKKRLESITMDSPLDKPDSEEGKTRVELIDILNKSGKRKVRFSTKKSIVELTAIQKELRETSQNE